MSKFTFLTKLVNLRPHVTIIKYFLKGTGNLKIILLSFNKKENTIIEIMLKKVLYLVVFDAEIS